MHTINRGLLLAHRQKQVAGHVPTEISRLVAGFCQCIGEESLFCSSVWKEETRTEWACSFLGVTEQGQKKKEKFVMVLSKEIKGVKKR